MARESFTSDQWLSLRDAGPAIARAVAASAGSRGDSERELRAYLEFVDESTTRADLHPIVAELAADIRGLIADGDAAASGDPFGEALEAARRAGAVLAVVADASEERALRTWFLDAARVVAAAAREGGLVGLGGTSVSADESATIATLADALGAPPAP